MTVAAFHDIRISEDIEQGAKGGPMFKTTIMGALSGREQRNIDWTYPRHMWNIGYGIQDRDGYMEVVSFFYARRGRGYAFRFKDWTDYTSGTGFSLEGGDDSDNRALIGLGTTGGLKVYPLYKFYADAASTFTRKITRPVANTTRIWINGTEIYASGAAFTVTVSGGIVTLAVAPSGGATVDAYYEYDVPVRFDMDHLETEVTWWNAAATPSITIVEVRE